MATTSNRQQDKQQDSWSDGVTKLTEAARHNMTASNLAMAGAVALGAAAVTYFWDSTRRNDFMDAARRWSDDAMSMWSGAASGSPSVNQ